MNNTVFQSYNEQMQRLTASILTMGQLVGDMIMVALHSLTAKDDLHKAQVRDLDKEVNALDRSISEQATMMLAFRSPMGDDLRFVTSALRIASDLERAGDLAKNTTKRSLKVGDYTPSIVMESLNNMAVMVRDMVVDALRAIETRDPNLALEVWRRDKKVDEYYQTILRVLQKDMQANPATVEPATHYVFATKNFERIGDYATSLARTVHYVNTGTLADKSTLKGSAPKE